MRPMCQYMVLSKRPVHIAAAVASFAAAWLVLMTLQPDAFKTFVSIYLAWRVARWVLLVVKEQAT